MDAPTQYGNGYHNIHINVTPTTREIIWVSPLKIIEAWATCI